MVTRLLQCFRWSQGVMVRVVVGWRAVSDGVERGEGEAKGKLDG